jgi:hypothetical protein
MAHRRILLSRNGLVRVAVFSALLALPAVGWGQAKSECTLLDCDQAKAFFTKFQGAINADRRKNVADMVSYPLRSNRNGKSTVIKTKADLLAHYDTVFDAGTRCAIKTASIADVWGNWRGFTVGAGVVWWDRIIPSSAAKNAAIQPSDLSKYPFGIITVNHSAAADKDCTVDAKGSNQ